MTQENKFSNRKIIFTILSILLLMILSSPVLARPLTDATFDIFGGGLLKINNFFEARQYEPYSKAIDFFFFALLFIAIFMMGARYAFKEMKRPEQVIVILLGLMTAFLMVLADISATVLLPYIHWLFYILLFILYFWLLKGIQNKFWRFMLALLLTILTIALLQGLFGALQAPRISGIGAPEPPGFGGIGGFFKDLFRSFGGISMPGVSAPGVPDYMKDWLNIPQTAPTGPETLPPAETPKEEEVPKDDDGWPWWVWLLIIILLVLLGLGGRWLWNRWKKGDKDKDKKKIIEEINDIIKKKEEARNKILKEQATKKSILKNADIAQAHISALLRADLANIWTDEGRALIKEEDKWFLEFVDEQKELVHGLIKLNNVENDLLKKIKKWKKFFEKKGLNAENIFTELEKVISHKTEPLNENEVGIIWLAAICYNYEKREENYGKEIREILESDLGKLLKTKFEPVNWDEARLKELLSHETRLIKILEAKIQRQIDLLKELLRKLGETPVTPPTPPVTPTPKPTKYDPHFDPTRVLILDPPDPINPAERPLVAVPDVPIKDFVDLSELFPRIKNQLYLAACVSFSVLSVYEYIQNKNKYPVKSEDKDQDGIIDVSELFLHWYCRKLANRETENTGTTRFVALNLMIRQGASVERLWPFVEDYLEKFKIEPNTEAKENAQHQRMRSYRVLPSPVTVEHIAKTLSAEYPVLIGMFVSEEFKMSSGVSYYENYKDKAITTGGHSMVIVGYNANYQTAKGPVPAFKLRNSWGTEWGENGYIWVIADLLAKLINIRGDAVRYVIDIERKLTPITTPNKMKSKVDFLTELLKTLRNPEKKSKAEYIQDAKSKITEFYGTSPEGKDKEESELYMGLVEKIDSGKFAEAIDSLTRFRNRLQVHIEREGQYKVSFKGKERTRKVRSNMQLRHKEYFLKLEALKNEIDLLIEVLKGGLVAKEYLGSIITEIDELLTKKGEIVEKIAIIKEGKARAFDNIDIYRNIISKIQDRKWLTASNYEAFEAARDEEKVLVDLLKAEAELEEDLKQLLKLENALLSKADEWKDKLPEIMQAALKDPQELNSYREAMQRVIAQLKALITTDKGIKWQIARYIHLNKEESNITEELEQLLNENNLNQRLEEKWLEAKNRDEAALRQDFEIEKRIFGALAGSPKIESVHGMAQAGSRGSIVLENYLLTWLKKVLQYILSFDTTSTRLEIVSVEPVNAKNSAIGVSVGETIVVKAKVISGIGPFIVDAYLQDKSLGLQKRVLRLAPQFEVNKDQEFPISMDTSAFGTVHGLSMPQTIASCYISINVRSTQPKQDNIRQTDFKREEVWINFGMSPHGLSPEPPVRIEVPPVTGGDEPSITTPLEQTDEMVNSLNGMIGGRAAGNIPRAAKNPRKKRRKRKTR